MPIRTCVLLIALLASVARAEVQLQERVQRLAVPHQGPFVRAGDGAIWGMDETGALVSRDEGKTWEARRIFDATRYATRPERALLRTREGVMLYAFLNDRERVMKWDDARGGPQEGCRLPVYVSRSENDGRSWGKPVLLQDGWCGAVRQMIQLRSGRIVLVSQLAKANPGRHVTISYASDDGGQTWTPSAPIDFGVEGNYAGDVVGISGSTHGGGIEGTVYEKPGGEVKLLLRVPHGHFVEMTSKDGLRWSAAMPANIEASDSPGMVVRLASGRLVLAWNRYVDPVRRLGRREELSIAFSGNDGLTWTTPQVIALNRVPPGASREGAYWISYPYVFEPAPGRLWISTMQGDLRAELNEADFLEPVARPLTGDGVRIITLGDSITRATRPGVSPTQSFSALLQARLRDAGLPVDVHNLGIGAERTDQALRRLDADVIYQRPQLVTVMYGTNDSWVDPGRTEPRLDAVLFEANLREIVRRLRQVNIGVVLMTEPKFEAKNPRNGLGEDPNIRLGQYMEITRRVAKDMRVTLIDHFAAWDGLQRTKATVADLTTDGCHPNAAGHRDLAERMTVGIAPLLR